MGAVDTLPESIDKMGQSLAILHDVHAPSGLAEPLSQTTLTSIQEAQLTPTQYMHITGFYRETPLPPYDRDAAPVDYDQPQSLDWHAERSGSTSPFALAGFILKQNIQQVCSEKRWTDDDGNLRYSLKNKEKVADAGLLPGLAAMSLLLERVARSADGPEQFERVARRSVSSLPMMFARMPRDHGRRIEFLYGVRKGGSYDADSAAIELGVGTTEGFQIEIDPETERAVPTRWDEAMRHVFGEGECPAIRFKFFGQAWVHLTEAALVLPETRAIIEAPAHQPRELTHTGSTSRS